MRYIWITGARVVEADRVTEPQDVLIENGRIAAIGHDLPVPESAERIDGTGKYLLPAFVELHAHGGGGADFADGTKAAAERVFQTHLSHGVTLLCPTMLTSDWRDTMDFLRLCDGELSHHFMFGGVHLEGPFLNPIMCGAQNRDLLISPTESRVAELSELSHVISRITVAPELEGT